MHTDSVEFIAIFVVIFWINHSFRREKLENVKMRTDVEKKII